MINYECINVYLFVKKYLLKEPPGFTMLTNKDFVRWETNLRELDSI